MRFCLWFLFLTACASTSVESVSGPDGSPHHLITCGDVKDCYDRASRGCSGKYQIVNTSNHIHDYGDRSQSMTKLLVKCQK